MNYNEGMISLVIYGVALHVALASHASSIVAIAAMKDDQPPRTAAEAHDDPLSPLQAELSQALATAPLDNRRLGAAYLQIALAHFQRGEGDKAKASAAKALSCAEVLKTKAGQELEADSHALLGRLLRTNGDLDAADPHYRRVCELRKQLAGPKDISVAISRDNLALLLGAMGQLDEAEKEHRAAMGMIKTITGANSIDYAKAEANLASTMQQREQPDLVKVTALFRDAVRIFESQKPSDPAMLGFTLDNLGGAEYAAGDFRSSEASRRRALDVLSKHFGADHPETATCEHNLALVLLETEPPKREEAMRLLQHAERVQRETLGATHPNTRSTARAIKELADEMDDGKMDEKQLLFWVRLEKLPNPTPEEYDTTEQIVRDVKSVSTDPDAVARLLRACIGDSPDGHILRAFGVYKTAMVPYYKALNARFGPDTDAGFTLGLPREIKQVKLLADPEDPASGFWFLEVALEEPKDPLILVIGPGERGPGKGFNLGAGPIAKQSRDRVSAAGMLLVSIDPEFLGDKAALAKFADSEAKDVATGKYANRNDAKDALLKHLLDEHATKLNEIPPDIKKRYMRNGSGSEPK
jgi:tetratricopeptide (TPR) repeat protein